MTFKNLLLLEEIGERQFAVKNSLKNYFVAYGFGNAVDAHGNDQAIPLFTKAIAKLFPGKQTQILTCGRFGLSKLPKDGGTWLFEAQMSGTGHPSNWPSESRGYYCTTGKSVFVFPKDDAGFKKELLLDFKQALSIKSLRELNVASLSSF